MTFEERYEEQNKDAPHENNGLTGGISRPEDGIHSTTKHVYQPPARSSTSPLLIGSGIILVIFVSILFFYLIRKHAR